jgi:hypothetical protein
MADEPVSSDAAAAAAEYDWLFDYIMSVFRTASWEVPLMMFMDENWCDSNGACYTTCMSRYC